MAIDPSLAADSEAFDRALDETLGLKSAPPRLSAVDPNLAAVHYNPSPPRLSAVNPSLAAMHYNPTPRWQPPPAGIRQAAEVAVPTVEPGILARLKERWANTRQFPEAAGMSPTELRQVIGAETPAAIAAAADAPKGLKHRKKAATGKKRKQSRGKGMKKSALLALGAAAAGAMGHATYQDPLGDEK